MSSEFNSVSLTSSNRIALLENTVKELSITIQLLQLTAIKKITDVEMCNLMKMLASDDTENHVIAHETINAIFKTL